MSSSSSSGGGEPRIIAQLGRTQLDHWGHAGFGNGAACGHVFINEEEHRGPPALIAAQRPRAYTTSRPLAFHYPGLAPRWVDEHGGGGVQSDASGMPFCRRPEDGAEMWAGRCPCWRHDDFSYLTDCEVRDVWAGVRFSARHYVMLEMLSVHVKPRLRVHGVARLASRTPRRQSSSTETSSRRGSSSKYVKTTTVRGGAGSQQIGGWERERVRRV
ncbi:F-box domain-containing protein [Beauveria bassiana ARSEF 2860]|uniref:F-box domain-containing protein n=1 Tax=Beauveria bassiana (strain ARSEF 2860) TaxID=655819 RepID=J5J617_BEAB2|nr:F-box domain-containing protein [Beauveria bassiana ARSEF 2860]EJP61988.1 F-box domain-containing protein [Beauveria bassiana ARSEF 2860]